MSISIHQSAITNESTIPDRHIDAVRGSVLAAGSSGNRGSRLARGAAIDHAAASA
jgi:hypothetical protein